MVPLGNSLRSEPPKKVTGPDALTSRPILNYFSFEESLPDVSYGLNTKEESLSEDIRGLYGFRASRVTELALYHLLRKLSEPELTHGGF
jgi:hypothetical protein